MGKEALLGIRCYIFKYIQYLDAIFTNLKKTNYIIFIIKSQFYILKIVVIKYFYNSDR